MSDEIADQTEEAKPNAARNPMGSMFSIIRYPHPYSMFHDKPGNRPGVSADRLGFINVEAPQSPKPKGETRILLYGNSVIRNGGFTESIPAHLERMFHAEGRTGVRVYNLGIASAINRQFIMHLLHAGLDLEPDLVITFDGYVDLVIPLSCDPRPGYPYNHHMLELVHEHLGQGLIREMDFWRAEGIRRAVIRNEVGFPGEDWENAITAAYLGSLTRFHELAGFYGFRCYSCFQPILASKKNRFGIEAKNKPRAAGTIFTLKMFDKARAARAEIEQRFNGPLNRFSDLSRMFDDTEEQCFLDMIHVKSERCFDVAERIYKDIAGMI